MNTDIYTLADQEAYQLYYKAGKVELSTEYVSPTIYGDKIIALAEKIKEQRLEIL